MGSAPDHTGEYRDAIPDGVPRGRGSEINPGNRFESLRLHVLGEHLDALAREGSRPPLVRTTITPDSSRSIINRVDSPDIPFRWTVNPYRGCEHGCIYCYARPTHEYLGLSCGLDFETKIHAKHDAPALLREALMSPTWQGEGIVMSGVTDPYQPVERELRITRGCLEVMAEFRQAVSLVTKNHLITRDLDLLAKLREHNAVHAAVSLTTLDNRLAAKMEPRASSPRERLDAIRELSAAGIPVSVMTAPIIPGLNDREIPALLEAARDAGATSAGWVLLRLPFQIKDLFLEWLHRHFPERAAHIESLIRQARGGSLYESEPFVRHRGRGEHAAQIGRTFEVFAARLGLSRPTGPINTLAFRRPTRPGDQLALFAECFDPSRFGQSAAQTHAPSGA